MDKQFFFSNIVALVVIALYSNYVVQDPFQTFFASVVFLWAIPVSYAKFILGQSIRMFRNNSLPSRKEIFFIFIFWVVSVALFVLAQLWIPSFRPYHPVSDFVGSFFSLLTYTFFFSFFLALYQFFFHVFILSEWKKIMGIGSVCISFAYFLGFMFFSHQLNDMDWFTFSLCVGLFLSGFVFYFFRSFLVVFVFSIFFVIIGNMILLKFLI